MNKATKTQAAWIELGFEPLNCDEGGWIDIDFLPDNFDIGCLEAKHYQEADVNFRSTLVRPKSLRSLEDNNGWTKIEKESDFDFTRWQFKGDDYWFIFKFNDMIQHSRYFRDHTKSWMIDNLTHFQSIVKPDQPLF